jgi:hypothetical protein
MARSERDGLSDSEALLEGETGESDARCRIMESARDGTVGVALMSAIK